MLRWKYKFWEEELGYSDIVMSNVSNKGDLIVGVNEKNNAHITLLSGKGDVIWKKNLPYVYSSQLSENGELIAIKHSDHITAYNRNGIVEWDYEAAKNKLINSWSLSRDGNYLLVLLWEFSPPESSYLLLLMHGIGVWRKPVPTPPLLSRLSISRNNEYVALAGLWEEEFLSTKYYVIVELYSLNGDFLWNMKIEGFLSGLSVTNNGEVLCSVQHKDHTGLYLLSKDREIIWMKNFPHHHSAASTPDGDRFVISSYKDIFVFSKKGGIVWKHRGKGEPLTNCSIADNCYVLANSSSYIVFLSPEGEVLHHEKINKISYISISPNGKYFAVVTEDCNVYFFENQYPLIRKKKERLIREIDELIKR